MSVFFQAVFGYQNDTLNFCSVTLNSEIVDMVLPCIEAKRFEISMFSWTWLLQQTAAMFQGDASDYNEDKRSAVAARMENKVVVEWGSSES